MVYTMHVGEQLYERFLHGDYQIDEQTIVSLKKECSACSFQDNVDRIFSVVMNIYKEYFPKSLVISQNLEEQIKTELLMQALSLLSTYTTPYIDTTKKFIERTSMAKVNDNGKETISYTAYTNYESLKAKLKHLRVDITTTASPLASDAFAAFYKNSEMSEALFARYYLKKGDYILEPSPLSDFIFDHMFTQCNPYFYKIKKEQKIDSKYRHLYAQEGRYLLAVLLKQAFSSDIPYTTRTEYGISLQAFNKLSSTLYYTYNCVSEIRSDPLEQILFLINSENIFHLSFARKIFEKYNEFFTKYGESASIGFKYSLNFIHDLQMCPLNSLRIAIWDEYIENFFEAPNKLFKDKEGEDGNYVPIDELTPMKYLERFYFPDDKYIQFFNFIPYTRDMTDCFLLILLSVYNCLPSEMSVSLGTKEEISKYFSASVPKEKEKSEEEMEKAYPQCLKELIISKLEESIQKKANDSNAETINSNGNVKNSDINNSMKKLKAEILCYLTDTKGLTPDKVKWCALECPPERLPDKKDGSYNPIPSIFADILNFLCTYTIFYTVTPNNPTFDSYVKDLHTEYGITHYLRFLQHKKKNKRKKSS